MSGVPWNFGGGPSDHQANLHGFIMIMAAGTNPEPMARQARTDGATHGPHAKRTKSQLPALTNIRQPSTRTGIPAGHTTGGATDLPSPTDVQHPPARVTTIDHTASSSHRGVRGPKLQFHEETAVQSLLSSEAGSPKRSLVGGPLGCIEHQLAGRRATGSTADGAVAFVMLPTLCAARQMPLTASRLVGKSRCQRQGYRLDI
jgi:hypothetical protein